MVRGQCVNHVYPPRSTPLSLSNRPELESRSSIYRSTVTITRSDPLGVHRSRGIHHTYPWATLSVPSSIGIRRPPYGSTPTDTGTTSGQCPLPPNESHCCQFPFVHFSFVRREWNRGRRHRMSPPATSTLSDENPAYFYTSPRRRLPSPQQCLLRVTLGPPLGRHHHPRTTPSLTSRPLHLHVPDNSEIVLRPTSPDPRVLPWNDVDESWIPHIP